MMAAEWEVIAEDAVGWTREHALLWRQYYLKKLGMIALEDET